MLNIGGGELLIILLLGLIVLGPARLPEVARQVGQTVNQLRGLARGFQSELEAAAKPDTPVGKPADGVAIKEVTSPQPNLPPYERKTPTPLGSQARAVDVDGEADVADEEHVAGGPATIHSRTVTDTAVTDTALTDTAATDTAATGLGAAARDEEE